MAANAGGGGAGGGSGSGSVAAPAVCRPSGSRWTPTPEQIRMLKELYYGCGIRSPSSEQIQRITAMLRQHGKIEGKNVFYWFQNHKARERQKRRLTSLDVNVPAAGAADATTSQLGVLSLSSPPPSGTCVSACGVWVVYMVSPCIGTPIGHRSNHIIVQTYIVHVTAN
jgi:hypothetical protein